MGGEVLWDLETLLRFCRYNRSSARRDFYVLNVFSLFQVSYFLKLRLLLNCGYCINWEWSFRNGERLAINLGYSRVVSGLVSKSKSKVAQNWEVLGKKYHNGGVRPVRSYGTALTTASGDHIEECQGERVGGAMVARWESLKRLERD